MLWVRYRLEVLKSEIRQLKAIKPLFMSTYDDCKIGMFIPAFRSVI